MQLNNDSQHTNRGYMINISCLLCLAGRHAKILLTDFIRHLGIIVEQPLHIGYGRVFQSASVGKGDLELFLTSYIMTVKVV